MSLFQPVGQVRMTNVAVVRLKRKGKRFEVACYKNKVVSWRSGSETDLDEVIQVENVFSNVSKGIVANKKDLVAAFGTEDVQKVILVILEKGELQVSEKERQHHSDKTFQEIASIIADNCVDPRTQRPYPVTMIERVMRETLHYTVLSNRSAKQQALDVVKQLKQHMEIQRALMRINLTAPSKFGKQLKESISSLTTEFENENFSGRFYEATFLIDPGRFREIDELVKQTTKGQGSIEIVNIAVIQEGQERLE
uniref:Ribosome maturation protein SBDS n=1 Tax=Rhodosorus marinus TaxID=101924 RepID=A0A7S0BCY2_9RHOD|mmetsp:Transcript_11024/g.15884  ORF Transcript_11024/g.15884 Transcript_11024/m.15884 type:complete len:253 (+) Transcript_11024:309-1067(+)